ncbi:hypothetical protein ACN42_g9571 [Penicillium freii]|uniref:Uncharacterized protein n=1 Tax=Penicillium freii TaxID=48697 RepID=A0A101MBP3_PENFR|nr:hypothetical protein ACN42_g9571 [Penicillium freii]
MPDAFLSPAVQIYLKGSGLDQSLRGHLTASSTIDQSRTAISPPRPTEPRGPPPSVMNTLFGSTPLAGIVQFSPCAQHLLSLIPFILGPTMPIPLDSGFAQECHHLLLTITT